jgi:hypothetical protein
MRRSYSGAVYPLDVVARRPGHDPAVMVRSYAKVLPSDDKRVREAFSAARSPVNGTKLGPGATLFTGRSAKTLEKLAGVEGLSHPREHKGLVKVRQCNRP